MKYLVGWEMWDVSKKKTGAERRTDNDNVFLLGWVGGLHAWLAVVLCRVH